MFNKYRNQNWSISSFSHFLLLEHLSVLPEEKRREEQSRGEMVRHVPWDEMPYHYAPNKHKLKKTVVAEPVVVNEDSIEEKIRSVGMKALFGFLCGGLSGGMIKTIEVLRDVKAMAADKRKTTKSILRFGGQLGG